MADFIRIVLVDDHNVVRQALRVLLNQQPSIQVVADASTGADARRVVARSRPDVILLDLMLPDSHLNSLLPDLRQLSPNSKVLILSAAREPEWVYAALDAGVDGYMLKQVDITLLLTAIEQVAAGRAYFHHTIRQIMDERDRIAAPNGTNGHPPTGDVGLTRRQQEVLQLIATTATNRDIAEALIVSEETIRTHVKTIYRKLGVSSRSQAVFEAIRLGIIEVEPHEGKH